MFYIGRNMGYDKRLSEGCKIVLTIFMAVKKRAAYLHQFTSLKYILNYYGFLPI